MKKLTVQERLDKIQKLMDEANFYLHRAEKTAKSLDKDLRYMEKSLRTK